MAKDCRGHIREHDNVTGEVGADHSVLSIPYLRGSVFALKNKRVKLSALILHTLQNQINRGEIGFLSGSLLKQHHLTGLWEATLC